MGQNSWLAKAPEMVVDDSKEILGLFNSIIGCAGELVLETKGNKGFEGRPTPPSVWRVLEKETC